MKVTKTNYKKANVLNAILLLIGIPSIILFFPLGVLFASWGIALSLMFTGIFCIIEGSHLQSKINTFNSYR